MLRRIDAARVLLDRPWWSSHGIAVVQASKRVRHPVYRKVTRAQFAEAGRRQAVEPVPYPVPSENRTYWHFEDRIYVDDEGLTGEQVYALLVTRQQRRAAQVRRAEAIAAMPETPVPQQRGVVPADVRQLVWKRDGARCVECRSGSELQFDHIIPVSLGGGSSEGNIQLLCGPCNRRKGAALS